MIGETFGDQAIYTVDGGLTSVWAYAGLPPTPPPFVPQHPRAGHARNRRLPRSDRRSAVPTGMSSCVTGDGAAGFNIMEIQSAARDSIPVTVIVFEGSWTMEEPNELALFNRTFGTGQGETRWDLVAEGARMPRRIRGSTRRPGRGPGPVPWLTFGCLREDEPGMRTRSIPWRWPPAGWRSRRA